MVISEGTSKALRLKDIKPATKQLHGPDSKLLDVLGQATVRLDYQGHSCACTLFVLRHVPHNLLGLTAIRALHVVTGLYGDTAYPGKVSITV